MMIPRKQKNPIRGFLKIGILCLVMESLFGCFHVIHGSRPYFVEMSGVITHFEPNDTCHLEAYSAAGHITQDTIVFKKDGDFNIKLKYSNFPADAYVKVFKNNDLLASYTLNVYSLPNDVAVYSVKDSISGNEYTLNWDGKRFYGDHISIGH